jgi:uroporphyrinogen decarboxylase
LSWAATEEGNPKLLDGHKRSGKAVMGGLSQHTALKSGSPSQVRDEVAQALEQTGGRSLLLAPGCAIDPETPSKNLEAVRSAANGK